MVKLGRKPGSRNPLWFWRFDRALRRSKPDVVHAHNNASARIIHTRRSGKRPLYVGTVHATRQQINAYGRLDVVCAISKAVEADILSRAGLESEIVYNGIDTRAVLPAEDKDAKRLGDSFRIIQVGRLDQSIKGQDLLIRAVGSLAGRFDISIDFVGEGPDLGELEKLAREQGVKVRFLGLKPREEVYTLLKDYDLFAQPSRYEGFGLTLVEAMAAGTPVVASDNDGPGEILRGEKYGLTFASGDFDALARRIAEIFGNYPEALRRAEAARSHALSAFDISATAKRYLDIYAENLRRIKKS